jgi:malonate-semialdehyde dehydrogenase (acetylating)/methylmalonate-semialdehyde dehydrogenase
MGNQIELTQIKNFINGAWVVAEKCESVPLINPSTGEIIGEVPLSTADISNLAVKAAADAYPAWSATPLPRRMDYIFKIYQSMVDNLETLAQAIAVDQAKHISEARGEVSRVIEIVQMALWRRPF